MSETGTPVARDQRAAARALAHADGAFAFGPSFFLQQMGRFVQEHCPNPQQHLPLVQIHLADGRTLNICHIIGVSLRWVVLAVRESGSHHDEMVVDVVPFEMIRGVSIRQRRHSEATSSIGFSQIQAPEIITAEALMSATMAPGPPDPT